MGAQRSSLSASTPGTSRTGPAGTDRAWCRSTVATVRRFSLRQHCPIIRINPTEYAVPPGRGIGIPTGALAGLMGVYTAL